MTLFGCRSDIDQCLGSGSLAIDISKPVLHRKTRGHEKLSAIPNDVEIPSESGDGASNEVGSTSKLLRRECPGEKHVGRTVNYS